MFQDKKIYKIAIISNSANSLIRFRGPLVKELCGRGHIVFALAPDYNSKNYLMVRGLGALPVVYPLSRTGLNPLIDFINFLNLIFVLKKLNCNVVLQYTIKPVIYGNICAWICKVPIRYALVTGLGYIFISNNEKVSFKKKCLNWLTRWLYKYALSKATLVFFQNEDDLNEFVSNGIIPKRKAFLVGATGVDLNYFSPAPVLVKPVTFIFVGRLLREKGITEFLKAAKIVKIKYPDTRFIVLGNVDLNPGSIKERDIEDYVRSGIIEWPGHVDDVRPWLAQASVFVLPSYYREGIPRSTQEAMAIGRAIITTNTIGCKETVDDGINGFLIPPKNVDALVAAIERLVKDPELIRRMGNESRRIAEKKFNVSDLTLKMIKAVGLN